MLSNAFSFFLSPIILLFLSLVNFLTAILCLPPEPNFIKRQPVQIFVQVVISLPVQKLVQVVIRQKMIRFMRIFPSFCAF